VISHCIVAQTQSEFNQKGGEERLKQELSAYPEVNDDFIGPQDKIFWRLIGPNKRGYGRFRDIS